MEKTMAVEKGAEREENSWENTDSIEKDRGSGIAPAQH